MVSLDTEDEERKTATTVPHRAIHPELECQVVLQNKNTIYMVSNNAQRTSVHIIMQ